MSMADCTIAKSR